VRANFFSAVDKWEAGLIVAEHDKTLQTAYGASTAQRSGLLDLSTSVKQLLLGEPSLLGYPGVAVLVDSAVSSAANASAAGSLGLTPVLVSLLSSADTARRQWATKVISACSRRPLSFDEWCENGIGVEVQNFYLGAGDLAPQERWSTMETLLKSGCLSLETIQKGLLGGQVEVGSSRRAGKSVMAVLSGMLGGASDRE
jgi:senataxin